MPNSPRRLPALHTGSMCWCWVNKISDNGTVRYEHVVNCSYVQETDLWRRCKEDMKFVTFGPYTVYECLAAEEQEHAAVDQGADGKFHAIATATDPDQGQVIVAHAAHSDAAIAKKMAQEAADKQIDCSGPTH